MGRYSEVYRERKDTNDVFVKIVRDTLIRRNYNSLIGVIWVYTFRLEAGEEWVRGLVARGNNDMVDVLQDTPVGQVYCPRDGRAGRLRPRRDTLPLVELERLEARDALRVEGQEGLVEVELAAAGGLVRLAGQPVELLGDVEGRDARADEQDVLVLVVVRVPVALGVPHPVGVFPLPLGEARDCRDERDVVVARGDDHGIERPFPVLEGVLALVVLQERLGADLPLAGRCVLDRLLDARVKVRHAVSTSLSRQALHVCLDLVVVDVIRSPLGPLQQSGLHHCCWDVVHETLVAGPWWCVQEWDVLFFLVLLALLSIRSAIGCVITLEGLRAWVLGIPVWSWIEMPHATSHIGTLERDDLEAMAQEVSRG